MRKIVHLSDLHFGTIEPKILSALTKKVNAERPDIVVVSGDLTQRAREQEFKEAHQFLDTLPMPQIVVPGNHDVPLYNLLLRTFHPLRHYRKYITDELNPFYFDNEMAVLGINTARSLTFKGGRINHQQIADIVKRFKPVSDSVIKILVTHHPFEGSGGARTNGIVGRAKMAVEGFSGCGIDLILSGHLHGSRIGLSASQYDMGGYSALMIQAGTATSMRRRSEVNSFNILNIDQFQVAVKCLNWDSMLADFVIASEQRFLKRDTTWSKSPLSRG